MKLYKYLHRSIHDKGDDFLSIRIDAKINDLAKYPKVKELHICGLTQNDFDEFIEKYAKQYEFIYFFKCPKLNNLSRLSELKTLKFVAFYWNNSATTLWDMKENVSLEGIFLNDFSKLTDLSSIATSLNLEELWLDCDMDRKIKLESIAPLVQLNKLERLYLYKTVVESMEPLIHIPNLRELELSDNLYPVETYAYLAAKMPQIKCECFNGFIDNSAYSSYDGKDIKIVGKGKPSLNSTENSPRIQKYLKEFNSLVEMYKEKKL